MSRVLSRAAFASASLFAALAFTACSASEVSHMPASSLSPQVATRTLPEAEPESCRSRDCIYIVSPRNGSVQDSISVFSGNASGNVPPFKSIYGPNAQLVYPYGVAVSADRNIYVANDYSGSVDGSVTIYSASEKGNAFPARIISGSNTGLANPFGIALDKNQNIYVANADGGVGGNVTVFDASANGNVTPFRAINGSNTGLSFCTGIALDSSGRIYVANFSGGLAGIGSITVYEANSNGNIAPIRTISGTKTQLSGPFGIAVDNGGNIFVTNGQSGGYRGSVAVYDHRANGNVAPLRLIRGSKTGLNPFGIALDTEGDIFVANQRNKSSGSPRLTVYGATANGDARPIRTISGPSTLLNYPVGIAVR